MATPNIPLLRKAVEWVEFQDALPEIDREWFQGSYVSSGHDRAYDMISDLSDEGVEVGPNQIRMIKNHCGTTHCVAGYIAALKDPRYANKAAVGNRHASDVAQEELGLDDHQAARLWAGGNTAEQIRELCEKFAGEKL